MIDDIVDKVIADGQILARKTTEAKTTEELKALFIESEKYSKYVNEKFGILDDFSKETEKYCELSFYIHMAIEEKLNHLEYYNSHPDKLSNGVLDFLHYLNSKKWLDRKNAE